MQNPLRKIVLNGLLISALSVSAAYAQESSSQSTSPPPAKGQMHPPNPDQQLKELTNALNLTSDQQTKIRPILVNQDQQMRSLHADTTMTPEEKKAKFKSIRQDTDSKMDTILNDEQKQQYEQFKAEKRKEMKEHHQKQQSGEGETPPPSNQPQY
jgi:periplasmic protein CpxP/Spy